MIEFQWGKSKLVAVVEIEAPSTYRDAVQSRGGGGRAKIDVIGFQPPRISDAGDRSIYQSLNVDRIIYQTLNVMNVSMFKCWLTRPTIVRLIVKTKIAFIRHNIKSESKDIVEKHVEYFCDPEKLC